MGNFSKAIATVDESTSREELYLTHHAHVLRLCRLLLTDRYEAEETAQEVFLKAVREQQAQTPVRSWQSWLTRVAVNACRDRRRSAWWKWWQEKQSEFDAEALPSHSYTPEEQVLNREEHDRLWSSVRTLSTRQREVFALHFAGWSNQEAADILGITTGSIKRHLFHAIRHLRKALGDHS